jgi:hypothetical protein
MNIVKEWSFRSLDPAMAVPVLPVASQAQYGTVPPPGTPPSFSPVQLNLKHFFQQKWFVKCIFKAIKISRCLNCRSIM